MWRSHKEAAWLNSLLATTLTAWPANSDHTLVARRAHRSVSTIDDGGTTGPISFVTCEPGRADKWRQTYALKSRSGLLERLDVDGERIVIRRRDGRVDEIRQGAFAGTS